VAEALGMVVPGSAAIPAVHADRLRAAEATGEAAVALARSRVTPDRILTASLFMPDLRFPGNSFSEREPFRKAFLAQVVERAAALPGVESAAVVMGMPLTAVGGNMQVQVLGRPEPKASEPRQAGYSQVSPNYFQTMGIPLLRGRHFDPYDTVEAPFVAIVNETFARTFFPNGDALGQRLRVMDAHRDQPTEIVGILRDTRQRSLTAEPKPEHSRNPPCTINARFRSRPSRRGAAFLPTARRSTCASPPRDPARARTRRRA